MYRLRSAIRNGRANQKKSIYVNYEAERAQYLQSSMLVLPITITLAYSRAAANETAKTMHMLHPMVRE